MQEKSVRDRLGGDLKDAEATVRSSCSSLTHHPLTTPQHRDLVTASERRTRLQKQLEDLYESVFRGPTPGAAHPHYRLTAPACSDNARSDFPEEDHLETAVRSAEAEYTAAQDNLNREGQALGILGDALSTLQGCHRQLQEAENASGYGA